MYKFHCDYTDFVDINTVDNWMLIAIHHDFLNNLILLLTQKFEIDEESAAIIVDTLWERMNDSRLHYHTPVHVLSILQDFQDLQENEDIKTSFLNPLFHLAIWFHDAVYVIGSQKWVNEQASALFMQSMLLPFLEEVSIARIEYLIATTAEFNKMDLGVEESLIMDLDILNFGWEWEKHKEASKRVASEFSSIYSEEEYKNGRTRFLTTMKNRGRIFRTQSIFDRFESRAMNNIDAALAILEILEI